MLISGSCRCAIIVYIKSGCLHQAVSGYSVACGMALWSGLSSATPHSPTKHPIRKAAAGRAAGPNKTNNNVYTCIYIYIYIYTYTCTHISLSLYIYVYIKLKHKTTNDKLRQTHN